jgi:hypothetical protein
MRFEPDDFPVTVGPTHAVMRHMKLAVRLATSLIWKWRQKSVGPFRTLQVCQRHALVCCSRHVLRRDTGVVQLNPLSRIFLQNLITTAQIMSFLSIPGHNTVKQFRRNWKLVFRMKDKIQPHANNRTLNPVPAVLTPNTLSEPQITRMVLKSKNGHRPNSQADWSHS